MSYTGGSSDQSSPHTSGFGLTPSYSALTPGQFGFDSLNDNLMNAASNEPEGVVNEYQFNTIPFEEETKADISKLDLQQSASQYSNVPRSGPGPSAGPGPGSRLAGDISLHGRLPAPSYFSSYFGKQLQEGRGQNDPIRALHIDRDPEIFRDIVRHLQGYYVPIRSPEHFAYLFADAQLFQRMQIS
ncbi:hypothetical protein ABW20_dc0103856 [Dactylellina cionopaga]|nr:hypothetical protein ABW20_dc0103856 [Dactylellina cionopaga]